MALPELRPVVAAAHLYPADAAFMGRTTLRQGAMLGISPLQLDNVTSMLFGLLGSRSAVRHEAGAGPEVLAVYARAGLPVGEERTLSYRSEAEAWAHADRLIAQGKRIFWPYPPPADRFPADSQLVSCDLYAFLNSKAHLDRIVPGENLPPRRLMSIDELVDYEPGGPVFLKGYGDLATAWGYAVRPCFDRVSLESATKWFAERRELLSGVVVEESMDLVNCWCACVVIHDTGAICAGAAEQLFSAPARQSGSIIDPLAAFPDHGRSLAIRVAMAAGRLGFRGVAGLDIGLTRDGRMIVFDPNFRFCSSTSQVLLHDSAAQRSGLKVSVSLQCEVPGDYSAMARKLDQAICDGHFVPTRIVNGTRHPASGGKHLVTGFVLGADRRLALDVADRIRVELLA